MTTRVQINPNLRLDRDLTMVDLDDDVHGGMPVVLEQVEVYEPASGLVGRAWVSSIDELDRTMTLVVDWSSLVIPSNRMVTPVANATGFSYWLAPGPSVHSDESGATNRAASTSGV